MSASPRERVVIVGASNKPDRYAHRAMRALLQHGHDIVLIHPALTEIEGHPVLAELRQITGPVDTVTLYVSPAISSGLAPDLIALRPRRVLFNPGTENPALQSQLTTAGIACEEACTLVLLATGAF